MNQWRKQFEEHPLHKELAEVNKQIDTAALKTTDAGILDSFSRLAAVIQCCNSFVAAMNPECTVKGFLDALTSTLTAVKQQLEAFLKSESAAHLNNANAQADQLVQKMPPFTIPIVAAQQAEAVGSLIKASEGLVHVVSEQSKKASDALGVVEGQSKTNLERLTQFEQTIESQKGRLDKAISDFQQQFSDSEATRRKEIQATEGNFNAQHEKFREKITGEFQNLVESQKASLAELSKQLKASGDDLLKQMEDKKDSAAKVLNVSTNVAVSGSYGRYALYEKIGAEIFRVVALVFMVLLIVGAYRTITLALAVEAIDWKLLAIRAITTFTLAIPAFYAVRESNKHRIAEYRYRKMQLELAAVDPYLELLDKPLRDQIKQKLSEKFFAQPETKDDTTNVDAGSLLDILKQIVLTLVKK